MRIASSRLIGGRVRAIVKRKRTTSKLYSTNSIQIMVTLVELLGLQGLSDSVHRTSTHVEDHSDSKNSDLNKSKKLARDKYNLKFNRQKAIDKLILELSVRNKETRSFMRYTVRKSALHHGMCDRAQGMLQTA